MSELGQYLRELRGKTPLREVSNKTGISHTYLSTLEKGFDPRTKKERKPSADTLKHLSKVYGVDYLEMLMKAGYISETDKEVINDAENILKLPRKEATQDDLAAAREEQRKAGLDLKEVLKATSSVPLYYGEEFISAAQKRQILKLVKAVLEE